MFKPIRWNTFPRDFLVIQLGYALFGLSLALIIQAGLGTGPWSVFEVAIANRTHLSVGTITVLDGFAVFLIVLAMRERIGWGMLGNILCIGPWLDFFRWVIPQIEKNFALQISMVLLSIFTQGIASAVYIGVDAGAGPRDSLMLAIHRITGKSLRLARGVVELTVFIAGWLLGGPAGIGTLIFAILIGPSVQWAFKVFNVHPHGPEADVPLAPED
jgi:uncharacterized membrane protein YczE